MPNIDVNAKISDGKDKGVALLFLAIYYPQWEVAEDLLCRPEIEVNTYLI